MRPVRRVAAALRGVDDRVLPPAAASLDGLRRRALTVWPTTEEWRSGAWRTLRRRPLLGMLAAVLALLAVAGGVALYQLRARPGEVVAAPGSPPPPSTPLTVVSLGPRVGERVSDYRAGAAARLAAYASAHPLAATYAVVDLSASLTPGQLATLLGSQPLARAFVRAPVPGSQVHVVPVSSVAALPAQLSLLAEQAARQAVGFRQLLQILRQSSARSNGVVVRLYRQRTAAAQAEAAAFTPQCACTYAVLVQADGRTLSRLSRAPEVRVVDPAPYGTALDALATIALQPEETSVVPPTEGFA